MDFLKTLVPMLGTALGGPFAGVAASFIAEKLGLAGKTVEAVTKALGDGKMTADQVAAIRLAEIDFSKFLEENEITLAQLDTQNTIDARKRDMTLGVHNYRADSMYILAVILIAGMVYVVLKSGLDEYAKGIITLVLGRFLGYLDNIYNFEFGTTRSSKTKDSTIENLTK
jgi:hypothetical protein